MSEQNQHTPGPWYADGTWVSKDIKDTAYAIAVCESWGLDETPANARLIAAAPELLEACRRALECIELTLPVQPPSVASIRAAISKAEGRAQ